MDIIEKADPEEAERMKSVERSYSLIGRMTLMEPLKKMNANTL